MNFDPVSTATAWLSAYGLIALFAITFAERFVPVIPSYGLLLTVGIAAAEGTWSPSIAFLVTVTGNTLGATLCFYVFRGLGEPRSMRFLCRLGRLFGMSADRITQWIASFRRNQTVLAFALQLVPTIRLFAPAFAALLRSHSGSFLMASAAGIVIWNGLFISIGYSASYWSAAENTTALMLVALGFLLCLEIVLFWLMRRVSGRRSVIRSTKSAHATDLFPSITCAQEHRL
ncbi:VTT domain-containing protein [Halomonas sp. SBBP1]|uniref:DedA family protein n=1 Tax=Halomonas sp. SBBP1 TaxID=2599306 RepID=UPI001CF22E0B|nr:membrane-associated protein [Halomonas sp. SBBP1]